MNIEIVTKDDLREVQEQLARIIELLSGAKKEESREWLRSSDVKRMLKCSDSTLKNYRDASRLPYSKVEGTYFYKLSDVEHMLNQISG